MNVGLISFSDISYQLNSQGYVEPASYVDYKYVESLYRRVSSFQFFLSSSMRQQNDRIPITFRDSYLLPIVDELLVSLLLCPEADRPPSENRPESRRETSET